MSNSVSLKNISVANAEQNKKNNLGIFIVIALIIICIVASIYITLFNYSLNSIVSFWIITSIFIILFLGMIILRLRNNKK